MQNLETTRRDPAPDPQDDLARPALYEPPRITAKLPLDKVTLFTGGGSGGPGGGGGVIGGG